MLDSGDRIGFSIGAVPSEPGYYFTKENAKLAVLSVYVVRTLSCDEASLFWERLFPRPISVLYPINDYWSDSITVEGGETVQKLAIMAVIRHSQGILFVDLPQLAYTDMRESYSTALRLPDNIDYCTTSPSLWQIREQIPKDNLCVVVSLCTSDMRSISGIPQIRVTSTRYHHGDDIIPDGTMVMTVDRISGSASDKYYILPKTNVHLRSIKECERYKACLDLFDGNEHLALREFWEREKCRKQQAKLIR